MRQHADGAERIKRKAAFKSLIQAAFASFTEQLTNPLETHSLQWNLMHFLMQQSILQVTQASNSTQPCWWKRLIQSTNLTDSGRGWSHSLCHALFEAGWVLFRSFSIGVPSFILLWCSEEHFQWTLRGQAVFHLSSCLTYQGSLSVLMCNVTKTEYPSQDCQTL